MGQIYFGVDEAKWVKIQLALTFTFLSIAWLLVGALTAPLTIKAITFGKQKLDRSSLIYFSIMGPIPVLYLAVGIAVNVFGFLVAIAFMSIFWLVEKIGGVLHK